MLAGQQRRLHAHFHTMAGIEPNDGHQLDGVAHAAGKIQVNGSKVFNPLHVNVGWPDPASIAQPGQHQRLVAGIPAVHVQGGVRLGIPGRLRGGECLTVGHSVFGHVREHVVAGAVDDAVNGLNLIANQRLPHRLDDGNATRHGGLEIQRHIFLLRQFHQFHAAFRQQCLVAGDDGFTREDGRFDQVVGLGRAAD